MSEVKGYTCDNPRCQKFEAANSVPVGWLTLWPTVSVLEVEPGFVPPTPRAPAARDPKVNKFDLCSNACVAVFAMERAAANDETVPGVYLRTASKSSSQKGNVSPGRVLGQHRANHAKGKHDGIPRSGCPDCGSVVEI